jgi:hypothetical protein
MHKNAMRCNETLSKWCKNKHGASKIIDTLETYQHYKTTRRTSGRARGKETASTVIRPKGSYNRGGEDLYSIDNKYTIRR